MPADRDLLYGIQRPRHRPEREISSSTSNAFSSNLTSLLSGSRKGDITDAGRLRSGKDVKSKKDDIFTLHRAKKRAAREISRDSSGQSHKTQEAIGGVDEAALKRSKRKMEEKASIYAAMKRGDYVDVKKRYVNDEDGGPLVDFDRKWAEMEGENESVNETSSDGEETESLIEYTDEFGRLRRGTRAELARVERRRRVRENAADELDEMSARPKMPANLIHGDTVQAAAFNPDAAIDRQMEELAARRDRSMTPPEDTHYDAAKEVRSRGTGFYQFSRDNTQRAEEMENLSASRQQTEQWENERRLNKEKKELDMNNSRRYEDERKSEREANAFLKTLGSDLNSFIPANEEASADPARKKKKGWGK